MFNLDPGKLLVIAVVAIILLGPDRLPQVARQVGGAWRSFNEFRHRMESEVRNTMPDLPPTSEIARLARSPSALLNHLSNMASDEEPDGSFHPGPDGRERRRPTRRRSRGGHRRAAAADDPSDPRERSRAGTGAHPGPDRWPGSGPPAVGGRRPRRPDPELRARRW